MFRPQSGQLWTFYSEALQSFLQKQGNQYVSNPASGIQLTPAFVAFFTGLRDSPMHCIRVEPWTPFCAIR